MLQRTINAPRRVQFCIVQVQYVLARSAHGATYLNASSHLYLHGVWLGRIILTIVSDISK